MSDPIKAIFTSILQGDHEATKSNIPAALQQGISAEGILNRAMIAAMEEVGRLFEAGEYYVPELMLAARAMQGGMDLLKPHLAEAEVQAAGSVVIATVAGDLHDIGKNLVAMMLEGAGFVVYDLGSDVQPEAFVEAVRQHTPDLVGMSALLTTTMTSMRATIEALEEAGLRQSVKVVIGGAPVTEAYAASIGADGYAPDASQAVRLARKLIS